MNTKNIFSPRILCRAALLAALSLLLGKFLQIPTGLPYLRISFENLPLLLCGYAYGPLVGALSAAAADLVGCLLYGYSINPLITLGAAIIGALAGVFGRCGFFRPPRLYLSVISAHLVGSLGVKTAALAAFYAIPLWQLFLFRAGLYLCTGGAEFLILYFLLKRKAFRSVL
ncbi:MAG: folate family ECF transporter S component [Clostridia bacterium]|nr:folate family ECF transporter S component [Clostridia bacterium]